MPSLTAPKLPYLPPKPKRYAPAIGLIGCGGITFHHLQAYRDAGWKVAALCDLKPEAAEARRKEFFPDAEVLSDHRRLLEIPQIEVVDIATTPEVRPPLVADALRAGKHVLSQKPLATDLDEGRRLADLADENGVLLAVNQNARWAPYFAYLREAVRAGVIGPVVGAHCAVHWDHSWVKGTHFEGVHHLILYDFAIHWFDFLTTIFTDREPRRVYAQACRSAYQEVAPPLLASAMVEYEGAQATLVFDGNVPPVSRDTTTITGELGIARSEGSDINNQQVELITAQGIARPRLKGTWFSDAFAGTMGELLLAVEEERQPANNARDNLCSLALSFAAVESSLRHEPIVPGTVRALPGNPKESGPGK